MIDDSAFFTSCLTETVEVQVIAEAWKDANSKDCHVNTSQNLPIHHDSDEIGVSY